MAQNTLMNFSMFEKWNTHFRNNISFAKLLNAISCNHKGGLFFSTLSVHRATAEVRQKKKGSEWSSFMESHKAMSIVLLAAAIQYVELWQ